ncbi:MAG: hypothetical protein EKK40_05540 [Bradyrhizobiaceae bacterium]|nr:MAG: hypothetical protein EKK40_05540 [Bradyrhizobiaceae bacterium]
MKKSVVLVEKELTKVSRVDQAPCEGFTLVVDGRYKNEYPNEEAAQSAGKELLGRYPMLWIEIYDSGTQTRSKLS